MVVISFVFNAVDHEDHLKVDYEQKNIFEKSRLK